MTKLMPMVLTERVTLGNVVIQVNALGSGSAIGKKVVLIAGFVHLRKRPFSSLSHSLIVFSEPSSLFFF
jgi:hypothetical protein